MTGKDAALLDEFYDSYRVDDGKRVVSLPRKKDIHICSNLTTATQRFRFLEKKLEKTAELKVIYQDLMLHNIRKDQVEVAPINKNYNDLYYVLHHVVEKYKDGGVKHRIVFDASSHEQDSPSRNGVLEIGPNLLPEILTTLLRFRT